MDYYFEEVSFKNLKDIKYLISAVYNREEDIEIIKKKYDTTNFGEFTIGYIAYSVKNDEPSGYYGVFPTRFDFKGKSILAAQSGDTMTHPNHRRKGLFTKLANKTYKLAQEKKVEFIFGFPVEASYWGFVNKLNWKHRHDIQKFDFYVMTVPLSVLQRINKKSYLLFIRGLLKKNLVKKKYPFMNKNNSLPKVERSNYFYDYKEKPQNFNVLFFGVRVWFQIKGETMIIADVEYKKRQNIKKIIFKLRILAFLIGVLRISFHVTKNNLIYEELDKYYNPKKGLAIGYLNFKSNIPLDEMCFTYSDFDTF